MLKFLQKTLEIIFPNHCLACNKIISAEGIFCNDDWQKLQFITEPKCKICSHPFELKTSSNNDLICARCLTHKPFYNNSITIFFYNDLLKKIIGDMKYRDGTHLSKKLAKILAQKICAQNKNYDLIIAIPLHKKRLRSRKFNQTILLASAISRALPQSKFYRDILLRTKYTSTQVGLKQKDREENLREAFKINDKYRDEICGKTILLIDDVMTTGATLDNCAKILREGGAEEITAATIAKAVLK